MPIKGCSNSAALCVLVQAQAGRARVMELLQGGQNTYTNTPEMKDAVAEMERQNPTPVPAQLINQPGALTGVWKVGGVEV
mgnify:CR=1 FL=1